MSTSTTRLIELRVGGSLVGVHMNISCRIKQCITFFNQYWQQYILTSNRKVQLSFYPTALISPRQIPVLLELFASKTTLPCTPVGNLPPKKMLKSSSGEMSASKSLWKVRWCPWRLWLECWGAFDVADWSPYWSYCCLLSGLLSTAYAFPIAVGNNGIREVHSQATGFRQYDPSYVSCGLQFHSRFLWLFLL